MPTDRFFPRAPMSQWSSHWRAQAAPWLAAQKAAWHYRFTEHPKATEETYLEHLAFTLGMGGRLLGVGLVVLVHGFFPFLFTRTASRTLDRLWRVMRHRGKQPPSDAGSHI